MSLFIFKDEDQEIAVVETMHVIFAERDAKLLKVATARLSHDLKFSSELACTNEFTRLLTIMQMDEDELDAPMFIRFMDDDQD